MGRRRVFADGFFEMSCFFFVLHRGLLSKTLIGFKCPLKLIEVYWIFILFLRFHLDFAFKRPSSIDILIVDVQVGPILVRGNNSLPKYTILHFAT